MKLLSKGEYKEAFRLLAVMYSFLMDIKYRENINFSLFHERFTNGTRTIISSFLSQNSLTDLQIVKIEFEK